MTETDPDKYDAILQVALDLFAERGFHGTAVPDIAGHAEVGTGTIYRYFRNKENLVNVLYRKAKRQMGKQLSEPLPEELSGREQFGILWHRMVDFAQTSPKAFNFLEFHHHTPYIDAESQKLAQEIDGQVAEFFRELQREGAMRPIEPELAISIVWGALVNIVKDSRAGNLELTDEAVEAAGESAWRAIARHHGDGD